MNTLYIIFAGMEDGLTKPRELDFSKEEHDIKFSGYRNADIGSRLLNAIIDGIVGTIFTVVLIMLQFLIISIAPDLLGGIMMLFIFLTYFLGNILYYVIMEYKFDGKSLGKMVTHTKVVTEQDGVPNLGQIIGRSLCRLIPLDFITLFFTTPPFCIHDTLSGTRVVQDN